MSRNEFRPKGSRRTGDSWHEFRPKGSRRTGDSWPSHKKCSGRQSFLFCLTRRLLPSKALNVACDKWLVPGTTQKTDFDNSVSTKNPGLEKTTQTRPRCLSCVLRWIFWVFHQLRKALAKPAGSNGRRSWRLSAGISDQDHFPCQEQKILRRKSAHRFGAYFPTSTWPDGRNLANFFA